MFVMVISVVVTILWSALWSHWYHIGYAFVVFFLYGLTATAFSYVISLFASSQLAAFAFAAGALAATFLIHFIVFMCIITFSQPALIDHNILVANFAISLISPSASLLRALLLSLNELSVTCKGFELAPYPGSITVYGGPILYLTIQFFLLMAFVIWYDAGGRFTLAFLRRKPRHAADVEDLARDQEKEVLEEARRVEKSDAALRVLHLSKTFGDNRAVDNVTFESSKGSCFALLGPNGAGKSTTISLIRGDIRPDPRSGGQIFIDGPALMTDRTAARNNLGVCPQFDAMDTLTVVQHLRFYAKVRGVSNVEHNVQKVMTAVGVAQYANRMAMTLSGGNKRKLSLGCALIGGPSVVVLDEVSSGMDAAARRVLWRVLGNITRGRVLIITTHSLEEADALATRVGIIARKMLAVGTADELRKRHGDAMNVHLVHQDAPRSTEHDMARIKDWISSHIPGAIVEDRTYHGQLRFSVPNDDHDQSINSASTSSTALVKGESSSPITKTTSHLKGHSIRALFDILERHKEELGIAYYSVSPTTLDQIFLNVVRKHNVEEENNHAEDGNKKKSWWKFWGKKRSGDGRNSARDDEVRQSDDRVEEVVEEVNVGKGGV
jgi:ATP-binding cassette subfamily A (ABC1) protein 3